MRHHGAGMLMSRGMVSESFRVRHHLSKNLMPRGIINSLFVERIMPAKVILFATGDGHQPHALPMLIIMG
jgi:hypothetical protein